MAAAKYRTARIAFGAIVAAGMIGGTAYFTQTAPAQSAGTTSQDSNSAQAITAPSTGSIRQVPARPTPAKRSRGS